MRIILDKATLGLQEWWDVLVEKIALLLSGSSIAVSDHSAARMKVRGTSKDPFIVLME